MRTAIRSERLKLRITDNPSTRYNRRGWNSGLEWLCNDLGSWVMKSSFHLRYAVTAKLRHLHMMIFGGWVIFF